VINRENGSLELPQKNRNETTNLVVVVSDPLTGELVGHPMTLAELDQLLAAQTQLEGLNG
jgi:hypothetical protein